MKLRIKENSVRLRLSKSEVEKFQSIGYLEDHTSFGSNTFVYALQGKAETNKLSAEFENGKITVFIPEIFLKDWTTNNVVGFNSQIGSENQEGLNILVEKDFKCLDETEEDQSDNYENPNRAC